jgi:hypothetical protein
MRTFFALYLLLAACSSAANSDQLKPGPLDQQDLWTSWTLDQLKDYLNTMNRHSTLDNVDFTDPESRIGIEEEEEVDEEQGSDSPFELCITKALSPHKRGMVYIYTYFKCFNCFFWGNTEYHLMKECRNNGKLQFHESRFKLLRCVSTITFLQQT